MIELDTSAEALRLRAEYDRQVRGRAGNTFGRPVERVGPLIRKTDVNGPGFVMYRDLGGLDGAELDELIADQVRHFAALGQPFEWKWHSHDLPADLPDRLRAHGFVPDEDETVHVGPVAPLAVDAPVPDGVVVREATGRPDLERIRVMEEAVWGFDHGWLPDALEREMSGADSDPGVVVYAEAGGEVVSASWIRFHTGTEFASLWGGSTLEKWRGRGIYRALVAYRARLAAARGVRYLQVDASPDSRPILTRLGLRPVAVTVPYMWRPASAG
ncbi:GNAT family N-acetyltransferase [Actinocatenispora rupis]|uniref:GNAT family N-acetyltransferase n=1 Tax=Actinocatenispora rupis TaxID=519421 RepID=UPI001EF384AC|nr:GNAT family N-acetyltransferase [Actinocatenispora rupis]